MSFETLHATGDDPTDWKLVRRDDGTLEMVKRVPYDGTLRYTTEERGHASRRKNSEFGLSESEVLDRYEQTTGAQVNA